MGWTLVGKNNAIVYLEQLKTKSPNEGKGGNTPKFFAMRSAYIAGCRGRARAGVAQAIAKHALYDLVEKIIITRVSSGTLDDDNLGGALKPIRDGIADALAVNDADFSLEGRDEAKLALHYRQAKPGRRKCCGVRIELIAGVS